MTKCPHKAGMLPQCGPLEMYLSHTDNFKYSSHLMRKVDSLEKTLMLGGIEGRRRRGWQRMRWLDGITDSMDEFEWTPGVGPTQPYTSKASAQVIGEHLSRLFSLNFARLLNGLGQTSRTIPSFLLLRRQTDWWLGSSRWKRKEPPWLTESAQSTNLSYCCLWLHVYAALPLK